MIPQIGKFINRFCEIFDGKVLERMQGKTSCKKFSPAPLSRTLHKGSKIEL